MVRHKLSGLDTVMLCNIKSVPYEFRLQCYYLCEGSYHHILIESLEERYHIPKFQTNVSPNILRTKWSSGNNRSFHIQIISLGTLVCLTRHMFLPFSY